MVIQMRRSERDLTDLLRGVGGLLFAAGAIVLLVRKSGAGQWSDLAHVAIVFVPAAALYLLALAPAPEEQAQPWQSVLAVAAILLTPVVLYAFLHWVGANTRHLLYDAAVFAVTGLLAGIAARRGRVAYAGLLAALSFLATWLFVWGKILDHASADTFRWLLVAAAVVLLLGALRLAQSGRLVSAEVAIAGGLAAVAAGIFGVVVSALLGTVQSITSGVSRVSAPGRFVGPARSLRHLETRVSGAQHLGWDIYLLIASLVLIWLGSRARVRGLGYVGAIGLGAFIISVGVQLTRLQSGRGPTHDVAVWPLVLLVVGGAALLLSLRRTRSQ
jgi:hypothetical protein